MTLFKVLYESMKILKVDTTARVIAALEAIDPLATGIRGRRGVEATHEFIFALHGRERVEKRATVRLHG